MISKCWMGGGQDELVNERAMLGFWEKARGTDFGVVETVGCKGGAGCFAAVVAMAEFRVHGVAGNFIGDIPAEA